MKKEIKKIAVFTSGGDAPGMNKSCGKNRDSL
jgi:6-phosphofructokinase